MNLHKSLILFFGLLSLSVAAKPRYASNKTIIYPEVTTTIDQRFDYYFYEAERCLRAYEFDKAYSLLHYCQDIKPHCAAVSHNLALLNEAMKNYEKALDYHRRAYEDDEQSYWESYVNILWQLGYHQKAEQVLQKVTKQNPKDVDALSMLMNVYISKNTYNLKKALQCIDKMERQMGVNSYTLESRCRILLAQGKWQQTITHIENYIEDNPDDDRFRIVEAKIYSDENNHTKAKALYEEELRLHPTNSMAYLGYADLCLIQKNDAEAAKTLWQLLEIGDFELQQKQTVIAKYKETLEQAGTMLLSLQLLVEQYPIEASAHQQLALYLEELDMPSDAIQEWLLVRDLQPQSDQAWRHLYDLYAKTDQNDQIEQLVVDALEQQPKNLYWVYLRTLSCLLTHDDTEALRVLNYGIGLRDDAEEMSYLIMLYILKGDLLTRQENYIEAFEAYESALSLNPDNMYVLNNYAYTLATTGGDLKKAEEMSQKTIRKEPDNPTYLDTYAWILHLRGDDTFALFYIKKAIEHLNPEDDNTVIYEHFEAINHQ